MKFIKQFSLFTFVGFAGAGINFFLMPYLSHFIDPAQYGLLSLVATYISIVTPFISLVAFGIINVEYFKLKDKKEFAIFFSSIQIIPLLPTIFVFLLSLFFSKSFAAFFELPLEKSYWIPLSVIIAFSSIYVETLLGYYITLQKAFHYAGFYLAKILVDVVLTILFVTQMGLSWEGRLLSWLITNCFFLVVSFVLFWQQDLIVWKIKKEYVITGLLFGLPLILHTIGKFVINQSDRLFIAKMIDLKEAGIYNIGYQVGMMLMLFVTAAGNFYTPFLYQRLERQSEESKLQIVKCIYGIVAVLFLALAVISIASPFFFSYLVDESYSSGVAYVFWVGLGYFFWGIYTIFAAFLFFEKNTKVLGFLSVLNVVVNLLLNFFLIKYFGGLGAAYATTISYFIVAVIVGRKVVKSFDLPWFFFQKVIAFDLNLLGRKR